VLSTHTSVSSGQHSDLGPLAYPFFCCAVSVDERHNICYSRVLSGALTINIITKIAEDHALLAGLFSLLFFVPHTCGSHVLCCFLCARFLSDAASCIPPTNLEQASLAAHASSLGPTIGPPCCTLQCLLSAAAFCAALALRLFAL